MNIRVEQFGNENLRTSWMLHIKPVLAEPLGLVSVLLYAILFITDTYYRNALYDDARTYVGGPSSVLGLVVLVVGARSVLRSWRRYIERVEDGSSRHYLVLTDEYMEKGITGVSHWRVNWKALTSFAEDRWAFYPKMPVNAFPIWKADLGGEDRIAEVRSFLAHASAVSAQGGTGEQIRQ